MLPFIVFIEMIGGMGAFAFWISYFIIDSECSRHSTFKKDCEDCANRKEEREGKLISACKATLFFPIWPVILPLFCISKVKENRKQIKTKEPQICICPECERKFLE